MDTVREKTPFVFLVYVFFLYCIPLGAFGQLAGGLNVSITLTTSPQSPEPYSAIEVSLNAYSINTTGATIEWYIDDVLQTEDTDRRSITVTTGGLGEELRVRAAISPLNGQAAEASLTIVPTRIDVIIEADTNVPNFYEGRALPSPDAPIRIIAIPHDGSGASPAAYTYKWELNNKVFFGGAVNSRYAIETTMPTFKNALLSVTVFDDTGSVVGKKNMRLSGVEPELLFYEENALRGLTQRTIMDAYTLTGDEVTVRAEPYYVNRESDAEANVYEWRVDGNIVNNTGDDPHNLTLRKTGGAGNASVSFREANTKDLFQYARGSFTIFFE